MFCLSKRYHSLWLFLLLRRKHPWMKKARGVFAIRGRSPCREVAQYSLIVGIAMDLPYSINLAAAVGAMAGVYIDCHIKKARNNNRTE